MITKMLFEEHATDLLPICDESFNKKVTRQALREEPEHRTCDGSRLRTPQTASKRSPRLLAHALFCCLLAVPVVVAGCLLFVAGGPIWAYATFYGGVAMFVYGQALVFGMNPLAPIRLAFRLGRRLEAQLLHGWNRAVHRSTVPHRSAKRCDVEISPALWAAVQRTGALIPNRDDGVREAAARLDAAEKAVAEVIDFEGVDRVAAMRSSAEAMARLLLRIVSIGTHSEAVRAADEFALALIAIGEAAEADRAAAVKFLKDGFYVELGFARDRFGFESTLTPIPD